MLARPHHSHPHPIRSASKVERTERCCAPLVWGRAPSRACPERSRRVQDERTEMEQLGSRLRSHQLGFAAAADFSDQILQRRPQLAKTERIPARPKFSRLNPLAGEQQFLRGHLAEGQSKRKLRHRKECRASQDRRQHLCKLRIAHRIRRHQIHRPTQRPVPRPPFPGPTPDSAPIA